MADRRPFTNVDLATVAAVRRSGCDPHELDQFMEHLLTYIYTLVPRSPFHDNGRLAALASPSDGVDRISRLPDERLRNIVARLPAKDGARTALLSSCWRALWRSTPLVLSDAHLLPDGHGWPPTPANSPAVIAAVSRVLEAHPGPFCCVDLVCSHMSRAQLARWIQLLAAKGVEDLVLVNRPWPQDVPLPTVLFSVTTLTSLYIGLWKLPSTDVLRGASFPHLVEPGICSVEMEHDAVESLVARSPKLEILNIEGCRMELRLGIVSQSLRCVQICGSAKEDIAVVKAPCLERLILSGRVGRGAFSSRVKGVQDLVLVNRPWALDVPLPATLFTITTLTRLYLGVWKLPGTAALRGAAFPNLRELGLCFVEMEHGFVDSLVARSPALESKRCDQPTGNHLTRSFWEESGPIENVVSRIHTMSLHEFIGNPGEVGFLEFFFRTARALRAAFVIMANPRFTPFSTDEAVGKVRHSFGRMASQSSYQFVLVNKGPAGGYPWNFKNGADFSFHDPFSEAEVGQA